MESKPLNHLQFVTCVGYVFCSLLWDLQSLPTPGVAAAFGVPWHIDVHSIQMPHINKQNEYIYIYYIYNNNMDIPACFHDVVPHLPGEGC